VFTRAFDNMNGFQRLLASAEHEGAVLAVGLFHGFGLATKLQEFSLSQNGLSPPS